MDAIRRAFPKRAIRVRRGGGVTALLLGGVVGLAFLGAAAGMDAYYLPGILRDVALAEKGETAVQSYLEGECTIHRGVVSDCSVDVTYTTANGGSFATEQDYLLFGEIDDSGQAHVLYAPDDPTVAATTWGIEALSSRWAALGVFSVALGGLGVGALGAGLSTWRRGRRFKAAAAEPMPVAVTVAKVSPQSKRGFSVSYHYRDANGVDRKGKQSFGPQEGALVIDGQGQTVLALLGAKGDAHLLDRDLQRLDLTDDERCCILTAVTEARRQQAA